MTVHTQSTRTRLDPVTEHAALTARRDALVQQKMQLIEQIRVLNEAAKHETRPGARRMQEEQRVVLVGDGQRLDEELAAIKPRLRKLNIQLNPQIPGLHNPDAAGEQFRHLHRIAVVGERFLYCQTDREEDQFGDALERLFIELDTLIPNWRHLDTEQLG